jgi:hypothetical protein
LRSFATNIRTSLTFHRPDKRSRAGTKLSFIYCTA